MKNHGEGLQAMAGLIPDSAAEEGDESIKMQVTPTQNLKSLSHIRHFSMQCLPLYSILLALGNPTVHHFSLDIEGAELPVLKTVPWEKVDIRFGLFLGSLIVSEQGFDCGDPLCGASVPGGQEGGYCLYGGGNT